MIIDYGDNMYGILIPEAGSKVHFASKKLKSKGIKAEVISTPMKLSKTGCSYSLRFRIEEYSQVVETMKEYNVGIVKAYRIMKPGVYEAI